MVTLNDVAATLWSFRVSYVTDFHKHCSAVMTCGSGGLSRGH